MLWWNKSRRAQSDTDYETWIEGGVVPTLNGFDNGDIRTTTVIALPMQGNMIGRSDTAGPAGKGYGDETDPMFSLTSTDKHAVATLVRMREGKPGGGKGPLMSEDKSLTLATANDQTLFLESTVRRLTPTECERLQGFPDGWTEGQSDSHRYKQMGNAVAVPVVEWLISGIVRNC
jgi:site-specific DNA-cytosine methylase